MFASFSFIRFTYMIVFIFILCQCAKPADGHWPEPAPQLRQHTLSLNEYITLAHNEQGSAKQDLLITAADKAIHDGRQNQALAILAQTEELTALQIQQKEILLAKLDIQREHFEAGKKKLIALEHTDDLPKDFKAQFHMVLAEAYQKTGHKLEAVDERIQADSLITDEKKLGENRMTLWSNLIMLPAPEQITLQTKASTDSLLNGWTQLVRIPLTYAANVQDMIKAVEAWQNNFPNHPANHLLPNPVHLIEQKIYSEPKHIALLLPLTGSLKGPGGAIRDGFMAAYKENPGGADVKISLYDTAKQPVEALYQQAIREGADYVIGPLSKNDAAKVAALEHPVPTLLLNEVEKNTDEHVYQFGLSPVFEAAEVAKKAGNQGHSKALILAPENAWSKEIVSAFIHQWEHQGGTVAHTLFYGNGKDLTQGIQDALNVTASEARAKKLKQILGRNFEARLSRRNDIDMIFLLGYPSQARQIMPMLKYYYAGDIPVYATSSVYAGTADVMRDKDLNGIIFCDMPSMFSSSGIKKQWPEQFNSYNRLYALGMDSFALAYGLNQLLIFPAITAKSNNGLLALQPSGQITRALSWGRFQNGQAQLLEKV